MKNRKRQIGIAVASALAIFSGGVHAQAVVFGDSLSDAGTYPLIPGGSRFTTNPGPVWSERIVQGLGGTVGPAQSWAGSGAFVRNPYGGDIWAQGGARAMPPSPQG